MEDPQDEAERKARDGLQEEPDEGLPRATRDYHPPTLLPPPSSSLPEEPRALRSVWIEPEVTVVKSKSRLSDYAPAVARARRAHAVRERDVTESDAPWSTQASGSESPSASGALGLKLAALAGGAIVVLLVLLALLPKKGNIVVSASTSDRAPIESANVVVDGRLACSKVPCRVEGVRRGTHLVRIQAPGYEQTAEQAVLVGTDEDALVRVSLATRNSAGVDVRVDVPNLRVLLDGSDRGSAPLLLRGLSPGPHLLRLQGNPAYAPLERKVELESEQTLLIEPKLVPEKATIHLRAGPTALGARVELVGGGLQRDIRELPATVEVSPSATYRVRAIRPGYKDYETELTFADGSREKNLVIDLAWDAGGKSDAAANMAPAEGLGEGMLGANSIPISNVLIDGRPVGKTPVQVAVSPGAHSVVFIHPTLGRKSVQVAVSTGKSAVAAVRF